MILNVESTKTVSSVKNTHRIDKNWLNVVATGESIEEAWGII